MAPPPQLSEDEIDDLIYSARTGDNDDLINQLAALAEREKSSTPAEILSSAVDEGGSTCLHMAAANGHVDTVKLLLSHFPTTTTTNTTTTAVTNQAKQSFLDHPNAHENTPLHWAALNGHLAVVKTLVEAGASVALANDKNYVPLDLAGFAEKTDVVDYFLEQSGMREKENENAEGGGLEGGMAGVELDGEEVEEGDDKEGQGRGEGEGMKEGGGSGEERE